MRGNLGAEIDAALTLLTPPSRQPCALIAPAFPAQGRGLEQGFLVHGDTPPGAVHLPTRLRDQSARPQALIPLAAVRAGLDPLCAAIRTARGHGAELLAADAMTEPDLARLLAAMRQVAPTALLCGSAGLVGALARQLAATQPTTDEPAPDADVLLPCRRLLFVVGSGSAMARQQMDALIATGRVAAQVVNGPATASVPVAAGHALLCLPRPEPHVALDGPAARRLATQLARVALSVLAAHPVDGGAVDGSAPVDGIMPVDGIVLVGGDTAMHVLSDLGVSHLTVHRELLPGMPLASAHRPDGSRLTVVLKAGNHGDPGTLVALEAMLSSSGNER